MARTEACRHYFRWRWLSHTPSDLRPSSRPTAIEASISWPLVASTRLDNELDLATTLPPATLLRRLEGRTIAGISYRGATALPV